MVPLCDERCPVAAGNPCQVIDLVVAVARHSRELMQRRAV